MVLLRYLPPLPHHIITAATLCIIAATTPPPHATAAVPPDQNPIAAPPLRHRCPFFSTAPLLPNRHPLVPLASSVSIFATSRCFSSASTPLLLLLYFTTADPPLP
ncbi:hypothetical protein RHGRI_038902 [Rhododendron griersonianum]|uniref:Secreted protein n=1 Tax=Rhododendron griersonianum TaxID=479676 RepID=A0AAV6HKK1_9ERIC|nr:hypothetical protein RHGRI_038902 [Rhododendron griersonianum]